MVDPADRFSFVEIGEPDCVNEPVEFRPMTAAHRIFLLALALIYIWIVIWVMVRLAAFVGNALNRFPIPGVLKFYLFVLAMTFAAAPLVGVLFAENGF